MLPDVGKTRTINDLRLPYRNAVHNHNTKIGWTKGYILPFSKKGDLGIVKNYRGIILIFITVKIYHALQLNYIKPEFEKIL